MKRNVDDLAKKLVDSALNEVGVAPSQPAGPHSYDPDEEEPDGQAPEDDKFQSLGSNGDPAAALEFLMRDILDESGEFARISTFADQGVMTENNGLLIVDKEGNKFQVTIVFAGNR